MDYQKIYRELTNRAKTRKLLGYSEYHHIIPKCIGGDNTKENLVNLTPEEHYVAHQLLIKIYPNNISLVNAAMMMRPQRPTNKIYGWLKRRFSANQSRKMLGEINPQYGTRWIHNKSFQKNKKISDGFILEKGWEFGRIVNWESYFKRKEESFQIKEERDIKKRKKLISKELNNMRKCRNKEFRRLKALELYSLFMISETTSLRRFATENNLIPMTISKLFRKYIKAYKDSVKPRIKAKTKIKGS